MKSKFFTPRRVFWLLMVGSAGWLFFAGRGGGTVSGTPTVTGQVESGVRNTAQLALVLPNFLFGMAQDTANRTAMNLVTGSNGKENVEALRAQIRALENNNVHLTERVAAAEAMLSQMYHTQVKIGLAPKDVMPATITGRNGDAARDFIQIDKGSMDGVADRAIVMSNLSPIGRVVGRPGSKTSLVQLTTDVGFKVQARILRPVSGGYDTRVTLCLVSGIGNGRMRIESVNAQLVTVPPERGDLVVLADPEWPQFLHSTVLGEVEEVSKNEKQSLRYELKVRSRENVAALSNVVVVLRKQ